MITFNVKMSTTLQRIYDMVLASIHYRHIFIL